MSPMNEPQDNPADRPKRGESDRGRPQGNARRSDNSSGAVSRPGSDSNRGGQKRRPDDRGSAKSDRGRSDSRSPKREAGPQERRPADGERKTYGADRPSYGSGKPSYGSGRPSHEQRQSGSGDNARSDEGRNRSERGARGSQGTSSTPRRPDERGSESRSYGDRDSRGAGASRNSYGDRTSRPSYGDRDRSTRDGYSDSPDSRSRGSRPDGYGRGRDDRRSGSARPESGSRPSADRTSRSGYQGRPEREERGSGPRGPRAVDRSQSGSRNGPPIPEEVQLSDLSKDARAPLRTLSKDNAEAVGRHLAMVVQLIDENPELAYEHAQAAVRNAGRVDVVREAAGIAAYRTGRYAEALRELRTVRRLNGSSEHLPIMADCERGLQRPERALALAASPEAQTLDAEGKIELAIVLSGARMDLGEPEAAEATLDSLELAGIDKLQRLRVLQAKAGILEATGRAEQAAALLSGVDKEQLAAAIGGQEPDEEITVFDLDEVELDEEPDEGSTRRSPGAESTDDAPETSEAASSAPETLPTQEDPA